jgi:gliding motility-associated-like protein
VEGKDNIKDLFNEKLSGFEGKVRPELWSSISSQITAPVGTSVGTGMSLTTKILVGISVAAAVGGLTFLALKDDNSKVNNQTTAISTDEKLTSVTNSETIQKTEKFADLSVKGENSNSSEVSTQYSQEINSNNRLVVPQPIMDEESVVNNEFVYIEKKVADVVTNDVQNNKVEENQKTNSENNDQNNTIETVESNKNSAVEEESIGKMTNIFTPNGDRVNDYLTVESKKVTDFSIVVLDQNSKIVYQSNESNFMWDGVGLNGEMVPSGNYVYYITARDHRGNLITKHSILRIER